LGIAYFMLHQIDPAETELLLALKEAPDDPLANFYLGDLELHQHQLTKALPYLKTAVSLRPKDVESALLLVRCYLELGDLQNAKDAANQAAALDPSDPRSHYMLAEIYQKLDQPADRQRELDLFNKLSADQKAKGTDDSGKEPAASPGGSQ
jgi:predicted Zn-dependent protease